MNRFSSFAAALVFAWLWLASAPARAGGTQPLEAFDGPSVLDVSFEDISYSYLNVVTGQKVTRVVTVRNNSAERMTELTVFPPAATAGAAITYTQPALRTLKPGQSTTFTFTVQCSRELYMEAIWEVRSSAGDSGAASYAISAKNQAVPLDSEALLAYARGTEVYDVSKDPASVNVEPFVAPPTDATGPVSYQWYKDGKALPGATHRYYPQRTIKFNDGGRYTVRMSTQLGAVLVPYVNVITYRSTAPQVQVTVNEGTPLVLSAANLVHGTGAFV